MKKLLTILLFTIMLVTVGVGIKAADVTAEKPEIETSIDASESIIINALAYADNFIPLTRFVSHETELHKAVRHEDSINSYYNLAINRIEFRAKWRYLSFMENAIGKQLKPPLCNPINLVNSTIYKC